MRDIRQYAVSGGRNAADDASNLLPECDGRPRDYGHDGQLYCDDDVAGGLPECRRDELCMDGDRQDHEYAFTKTTATASTDQTGFTPKLTLTPGDSYDVSVTPAYPGVMLPAGCSTTGMTTVTVPTPPGGGFNVCAFLLVLAIILLLLGGVILVIGICINVVWVWIVGAAIGVIGLVIFIIWAFLCAKADAVHIDVDDGVHPGLDCEDGLDRCAHCRDHRLPRRQPAVQHRSDRSVGRMGGHRQPAAHGHVPGRMSADRLHEAAPVMAGMDAKSVLLYALQAGLGLVWIAAAVGKARTPLAERTQTVRTLAGGPAWAIRRQLREGCRQRSWQSD